VDFCPNTELAEQSDAVLNHESLAFAPAATYYSQLSCFPSLHAHWSATIKPRTFSVSTEPLAPNQTVVHMYATKSRFIIEERGFMRTIYAPFSSWRGRQGNQKIEKNIYLK